jgi:predicted O-methyltransferase YrrM
MEYKKMRKFDFDVLEWTAKRFGPIPTGDEFLDSRYQWQMVDNGVEWPYYRFFYHLSEWLQPGLIVELGGYQGTGAAHFAAGYSKATVITIDHHTDPGDEENKAKMLQACDQYKNIMYIQGWTNPHLAADQFGKHKLGNAPNALPYVAQANKKIDILFIDSWHTYQNARIDFDTYEYLLNSPALVICDDIQAGGDEHSPISGMLKFWDELPGPKFLNANLHPGTNMGFLKYETG